MTSPAVFFDRDGTLNIDPGYLGDPDLVKLYPGVPEGISKLKSNSKFKIVVISNQSGITRGYISPSDVDAVNDKINKILSGFSTKIDKFYYCPYHPDFDEEEKTVCRKPSPLMIQKAASEMDLDLNRSYLVGDQKSDIECGINAGVKTILVKTNLSESEINNLHKEGKSPNFIANNFLEACNYILDDFLRD